MTTMDDEKLNHAGDEASIPTSNVSGSPTIPPHIIDKEARPSTPVSSASPDNDPTVPAPEAEEEEWVTGLKLAVIVAAITMAAFLMLLDVSIVATVSYFLPQLIEIFIDHLTGSPKNHQ
jgi:hypothetical protein